MSVFDTYFCDFNDEEISDGVVLALSQAVNLSENNEDDGEVYFTANVNGFTPRIRIDRVHGERIFQYCSCREFAMTHFTCRHVTAALYTWLRKEDDEVDDSPYLRDLICTRTGLSDPFLPGILRSSDEAVLGYINKKTASAGSREADLSALPLTKITMSYMLRESMGRLTMEMKAGPGKHYVVKNLPQLAKAILTEGTYDFGKNRMRLRRDSFSAEDHKHLITLSEIILEENERNIYNGSSSGAVGRYLELQGRALDFFMEEIAVRPLPMEMIGEVHFEDRRPELRMKQDAYGVRLHMDDIRLLARSVRWNYYLNDHTILRTPADQGESETFLRTLASRGELYIRQEDFPAVCTSLLPDLSEITEIRGEGLVVSDCLPEIPTFAFYLDLPQDNLIECRVTAHYKSGNEVSLYQDSVGITRNETAEGELREILGTMFSAYDEIGDALLLECDEEQLFVFLSEHLTKLYELGEVYASSRLRALKVCAAPSMQVGIQVENGVLNLSVSSSSLKDEEIAGILSAYRAKKKYHRLRDGSFLTLDPNQSEEWGAIGEAQEEYGKKGKATFSMPTYRALYLDEMLEGKEDLELNKDDHYLELVKNMTEAEPEPVPDSLKEILRPYQVEGFQWLMRLKKCGFGGILADDMGLGKTLQVITFLLAEKEKGKTAEELRTLIITPASLVYNWKKEIERFAPSLKAEIVAGNGDARRRQLKDLSDAEILITSYDLLKRDVEQYADIPFANEVIDEGQFIKNQNTQVAKAVKLIKSDFRMALTGTPIENRLSELWSIFDYLMPGFLYSYTHFRTLFEKPIVADQDKEAMEKLKKFVHPFILRRMKRDVLKELPDKLEEVITVEMNDDQRSLYEAYEKRLALYLNGQNGKDFKTHRIEILAELTKLRQLCCDPSLLVENYSGGSGKTDACLDLIHRAVDGGHKVLVFSQFTSMLDIICKRLSEEKIDWHRIDGSTKKEDRQRATDQFAYDNVPVFLISLKAGGTGLNLTAADIVIHFDPWWNVAARNQATDRAHRIGQSNVVTVYDLIAEDSVEERIRRLQDSKSKLAEELLDGTGVGEGTFDREELLAILHG